MPLPRTLFICSLFSLLQSGLIAVTQSSIESALLIGISGLKNADDKISNQRRSWNNELADSQIQSAGGTIALQSDKNFPKNAFVATHGNPIPTSQELVNLLKEVFQNDVSEEDLTKAIDYVLKSDFNLSSNDLLSAIKSLLKAFSEEAQSSPNINLEETFSRIPYLLIRSLFANSGKDNLKGSNLIRDLSQLSMEAAVESGLTNTPLFQLSNGFSREVSIMIENPDKFFNDRNSLLTDGETPFFTDEFQTIENPIEVLTNLNITPGISAIDPSRKVENEEMSYGGLSGFDPDKSMPFQQLSLGLAQGYFNTSSANKSLTLENFESFSGGSDSPTIANNGTIEPSIVQAVISGILEQIQGKSTGLDRNELSVYTYELVKAASNGFMIASSVAASSSAEYLDNDLHLSSAEILAKSLAQSTILHSTPDPESGETVWTVDLVNAGRLAEAVAHGAAMGSQLAMVQPRSMDYGDSYEIFTNSRREIAKAVARGASNGAVNASAWLNSIVSDNEPILTPGEIEEVARGTSLGAMIGNTGLAVYYPTNQLVPIINFTAQGSSYGVTSSQNLNTVKKEGTETIDVSATRESAMGSALGAAFEPTVLMQLRPDVRARDQNTINHLEAASFGSTFGAILGIQANPTPPTPNNKLGSAKSDRATELKQSAKQGTIEGALSGSKLALGLDDISQETLQSKGAILKAINTANNKAAANSNSQSSLNSLRTNTRDMLLLMKKFGINPRFTNPAKIYKRPVVVQIDEPQIDDELKDAFEDASPL